MATKHNQVEAVSHRILFIRGQKVMLDKDLAELFGVSTKRFNEQVKRNLDRFPSDFMFQLNKDEKSEVVANCDHLSEVKYSPYLLQHQSDQLDLPPILQEVGNERSSNYTGGSFRTQARQRGSAC